VRGVRQVDAAAFQCGVRAADRETIGERGTRTAEPLRECETFGASSRSSSRALFGLVPNSGNPDSTVRVVKTLEG
jgi:hypothetical protein